MNTRKGFTLVELLVVIAILAILATVSVVGYTSFIETTEQTAADTEAASIADAIEVALVMNKKVCIEIKAEVLEEGEKGKEGYVAPVPGEYILIERTSEGVTYSKGTTAAGYVKITEIPANLVDGLEYDTTSKKLMYTSDKGAQAEVK